MSTVQYLVVTAVLDELCANDLVVVDDFLRLLNVVVFFFFWFNCLSIFSFFAHADWMFLISNSEAMSIVDEYSVMSIVYEYSV
jgi:hypothetical protein